MMPQRGGWWPECLGTFIIGIVVTIGIAFGGHAIANAATFHPRPNEIFDGSWKCADSVYLPLANGQNSGNDNIEYSSSMSQYFLGNATGSTFCYSQTSVSGIYKIHDANGDCLTYNATNTDFDYTTCVTDRVSQEFEDIPIGGSDSELLNQYSDGCMAGQLSYALYSYSPCAPNGDDAQDWSTS